MAKLAKKKQKKENTGKAIVNSFLEYMSALWAVVLVIAVPLYMKDGYYQIGTAKYDAFAHVVVFGMPVLLLLALIYSICSVKETGISRQGIVSMCKNMSLTDWFIMGYLVTVLLSFALCGHPKEAFWGYSGWFMGLFSQLSFVLIYFFGSRFLKDSPLVLAVLGVVSSYVFVLGIQHRLLIDPIGVYESLADYYKTQFLSTLGQASWYSSFMTTVLPIGMFAFWYFKHVALRIVTGLFVLISFMTMVTQNTDSAYFGFLAASLVLFHVSVKNANRMRRFFEVMMLFVLAPKCMQFLLKVYPNGIMTWDKISYILVFDVRIWMLAVLCAVMIAVFAVLEKTDKYPLRAMMVLRTVIYVLIGCMILFWVVVLVLSAKGAVPPVMEALSQKIPYLTWNKSWGNGRGFTWSITAQMLAEMDIKNRLFGVGPDCYAIYAHGNYNEQLKAGWGDMVLTNAHNEWLNMFVVGGILGAVTYLGVFLSALVRFVKHSENRPLLIGMAACIAAYMAHNIFCYQQVLCTPFVFLFMAIGEYQIRRKTE